MPTWLLNPKVLAALAATLIWAGTLYKAYDLGGAESRAELSDYKATQDQAALEAAEANRALEKGYQTAIGNLTDAYIKEKSAGAAAAGRAADSLRDLQTTLGSATSPNSQAASRVNGFPGLESELLGFCAATLVQLAKEADSCEARLTALQDYVRAITKAP
jgi:hypothetical protein